MIYLHVLPWICPCLVYFYEIENFQYKYNLHSQRTGALALTDGHENGRGFLYSFKVDDLIGATIFSFFNSVVTAGAAVGVVGLHFLSQSFLVSKLFPFPEHPP